MANARRSRVNEKNLKRKIRELSYGSLEIAHLAKEVIRRRLERALTMEKELDKMMEELLSCAAVAEDKGAARAILSRFDAIRIEDLSKVMSVLKSCSSADGIYGEDEPSAENGKMKFEDIYE